MQKERYEGIDGLVRKGNVCDIVFWTDKDEKEVAIPVDDRGKVLMQPCI